MVNREHVNYLYREVTKKMMGHTYVTDGDLMYIIGIGLQFRDNKTRRELDDARRKALAKSKGNMREEERLLNGYVKQVLKVKGA